jgi:sigma-B regulation protein RsbU (phosphoserine phosphatase)
MTSSLERLMEDSKRRQQLEAELEIAREVQGRLFPANVPELAGLELLGVCRPAQSVSGDFFDYLRLEDGRLAISFGDVSGKGISAALVMASLHSILRTQVALLRPDRSQSLERAASLVVEHANSQLCEGTAPDKFSTLFFGAYDPEAGALTYSNAGHLPPLLLRGGEISRLDINGMIVGAFPHAEYSATSLVLKGGDVLVAYTDGVTEPENAQGEEYGEERLRRAICQHADQPLQALIEDVMDGVVQWTGDSTLQDDMTMLVLRKR